MSNQDDTSGWPSNINQIKWAMRHGQKIDGLENMLLSNQPAMLTENQGGNLVVNNSNSQNDAVHNRILEEQIQKLERSLNQEILSLKSEFTIVSQETVLEEKIDQLGQALNQEISSLKSELAIVAQGTVVEEQIDQLGKSINREILSLKSEVANGGHDGAAADQIDQLGQSLNQEISSLKSEFANVAQGMVVEEQLDQLGQALNREILSLKSEFATVAQDTAIAERIDQLGKSLNQEISSVKNELAIIAKGTVFEEKVGDLAKYINQDILSLRNEFSIFVQTQLNQEKESKIAEIEWKHNVKERESKLQVDLQEIQHNMMEKFDEYFQQMQEQLQHKDDRLRQEVGLLTSQLVALQQLQNSEEEVLQTQWQDKMEESQNQLIEDVGYIQYVVEEIATHPHSLEAQQKLRENFFIREIAALKQEMASICQNCKSREKGYMMADSQKYNNSMSQEEMNVDSEAQTVVYKKKRKRR